MEQPTQLGPFRIVRVIGRGGMGAVYEAVHEDTNERVAVKVLIASVEEDNELRNRFEAEIETLKRLRHPNIVRLYGFGQEEGMLYYAMEYVDGPSLQNLLKSGRFFTWEEVVHIGIEVCKALKHAHDRGIIHRDIKPANILILPDGTVKVSDYGIAHFFGDSRLTTANMVIGTIEYMSPEQAQAGPLTPKSDIYSLGALLYSLIARKPPYQAKSLAEILQKYKLGPPESVRFERPEVPSVLDLLILELLRIQPDKRPKDARIIGRRLEAIRLALGQPVHPNPFTDPENPNRIIPPSQSAPPSGLVSSLPSNNGPKVPMPHSLGTNENTVGGDIFFDGTNLPHARRPGDYQSIDETDPSASSGNEFGPDDRFDTPSASPRRILESLQGRGRDDSRYDFLEETGQTAGSPSSGDHRPSSTNSSSQTGFRVATSARDSTADPSLFPTPDQTGSDARYLPTRELPLPDSEVGTGNSFILGAGNLPVEPGTTRETPAAEDPSCSDSHGREDIEERPRSELPTMLTHSLDRVPPPSPPGAPARPVSEPGADKWSAPSGPSGSSTGGAALDVPPQTGLSPDAEPALLGSVFPPSEKTGAHATVKGSHFTAVREEDLGRLSHELESRPRYVSLKIWIFSVTSILLGFLCVHLLKSPGADALYERIDRRLQDVGPDDYLSALRNAEKDMKSFLTLYPNDTRATKILDYTGDLELGNLERRLERLIERKSRARDLDPVETIYIEAIQTAKTNPEQGIPKLKAFIDLFSSSEDAIVPEPAAVQDGPAAEILTEGDETNRTHDRKASFDRTVYGQCVILARRQLEQISKEYDQAKTAQIHLLENRLEFADSLELVDPGQALGIRRAIISLYADHDWAANVVETAQKKLPGDKNGQE